mmetsp:Transcript_35494/g.85643  ORF Transcript_35494/g.85643 Transcript_35494/m.85643 type:complete len:233 (-) Transcript_35494:38-736(-)
MLSILLFGKAGRNFIVLAITFGGAAKMAARHRIDSSSPSSFDSDNGLAPIIIVPSPSCSTQTALVPKWIETLSSSERSSSPRNNFRTMPAAPPDTRTAPPPQAAYRAASPGGRTCRSPSAVNATVSPSRCMGTVFMRSIRVSCRMARSDSGQIHAPPRSPPPPPPGTSAVRRRPPTRCLASRIETLFPSASNLCAAYAPLNPAPTMHTSTMILFLSSVCCISTSGVLILRPS